MAIHIQDSAGNAAASFSGVSATDAQGFYVKHKEHDGTLIDIVKPENLRFTLNKKDVHTISYEYSHAQGVTEDFVGAYRTDFELWYNDTPIFAGMHTSAPQVNREEGFTSIAGKDWKHYLDRRHYPFNYGTAANNYNEVNDYQEAGTPQGYAFYYTNVDVVVVAKKLLDVTLGRPNSLQITYPTLTTNLGIPTTFGLALADEQTILSYIESLSDINPGFDYDIDFYKELRFYSPKKYDPTVGDTTLDAATRKAMCSYVFEGTELDKIVDGPRFANNGPLATHWMASGQGTGNARMGASLGYDASQEVYRRLDGTASYGDVDDKTDMLNRAMRDFSFALNPAHEIEIQVIANQITDFFTIFLPGYPIWLDGDLLSHHIQSAQEMVMIDVEANTEGDILATLGLNQIYYGSAGVNQG